MYSSNSSLNGNNLAFSSKSPFCNSFESNSTENIIHSPFPLPPLSFFQFPNYSDDIDPFQDNHQIFLQQQHDVDFQLHHHHPPPVVMNNSIIKANNNNIVNNLLPAAADGKGKTVVDRQIQRIKRSSKRDRHSKIKTAKGLRDRRMRLSLEVAKRFFGLQDMLGFEKASKTVDWLLNQSKVEIKHLAREKNVHFPTNSASSTSECTEGVSSLDNEVGNLKIVMKKRRNSTNKVYRKSAFNSVGREKARERARERTKEKKKARTSLVDESNSKQYNEEGIKTNLIWNPFESVKESAGTHQSTQCVNHHPSFEAERTSQKAKKQHSDEDEDDSFFIMSKWSPPMMFNSLNNLQQHQFEQFQQSMEKPWEAYNNRI